MTKRREVNSGDKFNYLTIVEEIYNVSPRKFKVQCNCGKITEVFLGNLTRNHTTSCGCQASKSASIRAKTHGMSKTSAYRSWQEMKNRCTNPQQEHYDIYGGRGITVHKPWLESFQDFLKYIGPKPSGSGWSVERIDVDGNYEPGNVVWANSKQQNRNRRKFRNNMSGTTGVSIRDYKGNIRFVAFWRDLNGREHSKSFSTNKYGGKAEQMAIDYRQQMLEELNLQRAGYSEKHGK